MPHHIRIQGLTVMGDRQDIPRLARELEANQVIMAMPSAPGKEIREIVTICEKARLQAKIIPGIFELLDGAVSVKQLRDVRIEDLLRREAVETDVAVVQASLAGKRVLITGGGGSIGSELCRQVWRCGPAQLILLGHGENSVFEAYHELRRLGVTGGTVDGAYCRRALSGTHSNPDTAAPAGHYLPRGGP
jgi:FlaA1/EpsC-like NDP-sugar epimerase